MVRGFSKAQKHVKEIYPKENDENKHYKTS